MTRHLPLLVLLGLLPACANAPHARSEAEPSSASVEPLVLEGTAYEAAAEVKLPPVPPGEGPGLHNVYELSDQIISGAEPENREALAQIASWGVRTILSVDGKVPDVEGAEALGMRYVHVPIEYSGLSEEEILKISKTFRELEGPFYVHCYHGKHRGPAAAALGRVVLDQVPRSRAIAEMRQWCATASKYEGLYSTVATAHIPSADESRAFAFDFESAHSFDGLRACMIEMTRKWDLIKDAKKRGWQPDPEHPDVVALQEATQLHQLYEACSSLEEMRAWPDDFRAWMEDGRSGSEQLVRALSECSMQSEDLSALGDWLAQADTAYTRIADSCASCHASYRD